MNKEKYVKFTRNAITFPQKFSDPSHIFMSFSFRLQLIKSRKYARDEAIKANEHKRISK